MTREHTPQPGAHWATRVGRVEQVVPDATDDGPGDPGPPRLNRRQRRSIKRAARRPRPTS